KNTPPEEKKHQSFQKKSNINLLLFKNCLKAFFVGGFICFIGQIISTFYIHFFDFTEQTSGNPTVATLIFITMLLTGFGVYFKIAQIAGSGIVVPLTVFVNSFISYVI